MANQQVAIIESIRFGYEIAHDSISMTEVLNKTFELKNQWFTKMKYFFKSNIKCSMVFCGQFVPTDFEFDLGRTVFLCRNSHPICDHCYFRLDPVYTYYLHSYEIKKRICILCRSLYNCVQVRHVHDYDLRNVIKPYNPQNPQHILL